MSSLRIYSSTTGDEEIRRSVEIFFREISEGRIFWYCSSLSGNWKTSLQRITTTWRSDFSSSESPIWRFNFIFARKCWKERRDKSSVTRMSLCGKENSNFPFSFREILRGRWNYSRWSSPIRPNFLIYTYTWEKAVRFFILIRLSAILHRPNSQRSIFSLLARDLSRRIYF